MQRILHLQTLSNNITCALRCVLRSGLFKSTVVLSLLCSPNVEGCLLVMLIGMCRHLIRSELLWVHPQSLPRGRPTCLRIAGRQRCRTYNGHIGSPSHITKRLRRLCIDCSSAGKTKKLGIRPLLLAALSEVAGGVSLRLGTCIPSSLLSNLPRRPKA